jgi:copper homeostasis protein
MIFEICADSIDAVLLAKKYGVQRVELCSALTLGGLTPSIGLIEKCTEVAEVEIHVMIRHTAGGFVYSELDIQIMETDIKAAKEGGSKGVVFGCLSADRKIDKAQNKRLVSLASDLNLEVTFHRAFDFCADTQVALEEIIDLGFDRLLSSGQAKTAENGIPILRDLVDQAQGLIQIMAGAGVNENNALEISRAGVDALHFTIHHKTEDGNELGMGVASQMNEAKLRAIIEQF